MKIFNIFKKNKTINDSNDSNILIPSATTYNQLEQLNAHGVLGSLSELFIVTIRGSVNVQFGNATLIRCISLIASVVAQLVSQGSLSVVDKNTGKNIKPVSGSPASYALELLTGKPDGVENSYTWVENLMYDLLTSSNYLVRVDRTLRGRPIRLVRQDISDAIARRLPSGDIVYECRDWDSESHNSKTILSRYEVAHGLWGSLRMKCNSNGEINPYFAVPILSLLRPALDVATRGEQFVSDFFKGGAAQTPFVVIFDEIITTEQRDQLDKYLSSRKGRTPLILGGNSGGEPPKIYTTQGTPQRRDTLELREYQNEEISRIYGLPSPLVGTETSTWGAGISELGRLGWRFGIRQHTDRFLTPLGSVLLPSNQMFRVDPTELIRGNPEQLAGAIQVLLGGPNGPPVISRKEGRKMLGLPTDVDGELEYSAVPENNME